MKEKIYELYEQGYSIDEIAEELGENECVQSFRECPHWCYENADCYDCWMKCLEEELEIKDHSESEGV